MFTVCPKCALTLVVTAQDLRVAQGYVRCGRCQNVFNAIVGLTDDRGMPAGGSQGSAPSTATTTIIRKAPSIADDEPAHDTLSDTRENEAIYAEPDSMEVHVEDVFAEAPPPAASARPTAPRPTTARSPAPPSRVPKSPAPAPRPPAPAPRAAGPAPPVKPNGAGQATPKAAPPKAAPPRSDAAKPAPAKPQVPATPPAPARAPAAERRYSDDDPDEAIPDRSLEFNPAADLTQVFVEAKPDPQGDPTGTFESIVLRSEETLSLEAEPPLPRPSRDPEDVQIEHELRSLAAKLDAGASQPASKAGDGEAGRDAGNIYEKARPAGAKAAGRKSGTTPGAGAGTSSAEAEAAAESFTPPPGSASKRAAWIAGGAVLALLLAAQAVHHNRHDLATNPRLNRPLTSFYAAIGVPLVPHWDLASYDVRQLGASSDGTGGNLTVRASLKNQATQPLPLPLLRITMQDRYGNRIASRDVPPTGYVPGAVPANAHLGVGQRIDAEMTFKDPGQDAVGFEIDACLPSPEGRIACANDATTASR